MNEILISILSTRSVSDRSGRIYNLHSNLPIIECTILSEWLKLYKPKKLLEIGMAYGISSLVISDYARKDKSIRFDIIDPNQKEEWNNIGLYNLTKVEFFNFKFYSKRSEIFLPEQCKKGIEYDFAFVDGWHSFDQVFVEFFYLHRLLAIGGLLVFDDLHLDSIQSIIKYISYFGGYERVPIPKTKFAKELKIRQMMKIPELRIMGLRKIAHINHPFDWSYNLE